MAAAPLGAADVTPEELEAAVLAMWTPGVRADFLTRVHIAARAAEYAPGCLNMGVDAVQLFGLLAEATGYYPETLAPGVHWPFDVVLRPAGYLASMHDAGHSELAARLLRRLVTPDYDVARGAARVLALALAAPEKHAELRQTRPRVWFDTVNRAYLRVAARGAQALDARAFHALLTDAWVEDERQEAARRKRRGDRIEQELEAAGELPPEE